MNKPRVVVCAAVKLRTANEIYLFCAPRHYDETMALQMGNSLNCGEDLQEEEQGFIDQFGVFMTREEAWEVAKEAGQIKYRCGGDEGQLFSENLY